MLSDRTTRRRLIVFVVLVGLCLAMLVVSGSAPVQELRRGVHFAVAPVQETLSDGTRAVTDVLGAFGEIESPAAREPGPAVQRPAARRSSWARWTPSWRRTGA